MTLLRAIPTPQRRDVEITLFDMQVRHYVCNRNVGVISFSNFREDLFDGNKFYNSLHERYLSCNEVSKVEDGW